MWTLIPEPDSGKTAKTIKWNHGRVIFSGIDLSAPRDPWHPGSNN